MATISKAIAAFCTSAIGVVGTVYSDGKVETPEVIIGVLTVIGVTAGVWIAPKNKEA